MDSNLCDQYKMVFSLWHEKREKAKEEGKLSESIPWYLMHHHKLLPHLRTAAENGCPLCVIFLGYLEKEVDRFHSPSRRSLLALWIDGSKAINLHLKMDNDPFPAVDIPWSVRFLARRKFTYVIICQACGLFRTMADTRLNCTRPLTNSERTLNQRQRLIVQYQIATRN